MDINLKKGPKYMTQKLTGLQAKQTILQSVRDLNTSLSTTGRTTFLNLQKDT